MYSFKIQWITMTILVHSLRYSHKVFQKIFSIVQVNMYLFYTAHCFIAGECRNLQELNVSECFNVTVSEHVNNEHLKATEKCILLLYVHIYSFLKFDFDFLNLDKTLILIDFIHR